MPGHVFILRGDIRLLACDAWLIPCDSRARPSRANFLPEAVGLDQPWPEPTPEFRDLRTRVLRGRHWDADDRQAWLVNVGYESRSGQDEEEFYRQSVGEALRAVLASLGAGHTPRNRREVPLLALPLLGGGLGMPMVKLGRTLRTLLEITHDELRRAPGRVDVVLVTLGAKADAAAQHQRRQFAAAAWSELAQQDREQAEGLARQAEAGSLALFMGAGTGVGCGLPSWNQLLRELAEQAGVAGTLQASLLDQRRDVRDQASYIQERLGGPVHLQTRVVDLIGASSRRHSLAHALLACLPVREAITTNYDRCFEAAWEWAEAEPVPQSHGVLAGQRPSIIPHAIRADARRWLLKLHGCVTRPDSIVLTRESYIRYNHQYAALEGILQATLLTRHMLFVGFSLRDDNFIRILDAVRRVVRPADATASHRPFGSALMMGKDDVTQGLYRGDLHWLALSEKDELAMNAADFQGPGRKLELFLDYLLCRTGAVSYLLDDDFEAILDEREQRLRDALRPLLDLARTDASQTPVWRRVRNLLAELGHTPP
jgi:hypothetical protein